MAGQGGALRPDGKSSNAAAIVGGLVALGAVLLVLVVSASGSSKSTGSKGVATGTTDGAAGLPTAPTQSTGGASPASLPRVPVDPQRQAQPVEDVAAEPDAHVDGLFSCHNMVEPERRTERRGCTAAASWPAFVLPSTPLPVSWVMTSCRSHCLPWAKTGRPCRRGARSCADPRP